MSAETQIAAGPALDELIAKEVMGHFDEATGWYGPFSYHREGETRWVPGEIAGGYANPRAYSTSYEGMGQVLERMRPSYFFKCGSDLESGRAFAYWCSF